MVGVRTHKLVEGLRGPLQLLRLRVGVHQRPGVFQLRDGPLEIERRAEIGRQILTAFEPIDFERRVVVVTALAQPAKKRQFAGTKPNLGSRRPPHAQQQGQ